MCPSSVLPHRCDGHSQHVERHVGHVGLHRDPVHLLLTLLHRHPCYHEVRSMHARARISRHFHECFYNECNAMIVCTQSDAADNEHTAATLRQGVRQPGPPPGVCVSRAASPAPPASLLQPAVAHTVKTLRAILQPLILQLNYVFVILNSFLVNFVLPCSTENSLFYARILYRCIFGICLLY